MTTIATAHYGEVLHQITALSMEEQLRLIGEISVVLRKRMPAVSDSPSAQNKSAASVKGKYAFIPTSSALFAQNKIWEIALER